MIVRLGNFTTWRMRRFFILVFVLFLFFQIILHANQNTSVNTLILVGALVCSAILMEIPQVRGKTKHVSFSDDGERILITKTQSAPGAEGEQISINRKDIDLVECKEVLYGGKFLDVIGYRIIVKTNTKKYKFDSDFISDDYDPKTDFEKLKSFLENKSR